MFDPVEIQEMIAEEIELITAMCRGHKHIKPLEVDQPNLETALLYAAGQEPDEPEQKAA